MRPFRFTLKDRYNNHSSCFLQRGITTRRVSLCSRCWHPSTQLPRHSCARRRGCDGTQCVPPFLQQYRGRQRQQEHPARASSCYDVDKRQRGDVVQRQAAQLQKQALMERDVVIEMLVGSVDSVGSKQKNTCHWLCASMREVFIALFVGCAEYDRVDRFHDCCCFGAYCKYFL